MQDITEQLESYATRVAADVPPVSADEARATATAWPSPGNQRRHAGRHHWRVVVAATAALATSLATAAVVFVIAERHPAAPIQRVQTVPPSSPLPPGAAAEWGQAAQIVFGEGATWVALGARPAGPNGSPSGPGGVVRVTAAASGLASAPWVQADHLSGAAVGFGSIWTESFDNNTVDRFDARTGHLVAVVHLVPPPGLVDHLFLGAGITTTDLGVWVVTGRGYVEEINPATNQASSPLKMTGNFPEAIVGAGQVAWTARGLDGVTRLDNTAAAPLSVKFQLGGHPASPMIVAFGQGRVWAAGVVLQRSDNTLSTADTGFVASLDPLTGRLLSMTSVELPVGGLAVTDGAVWVRTWSGLLLAVTPGGVLPVHADVGAGVVLIAGGLGDIWVARTDGSLARVDPRTGRVTVVRLVVPPPLGWVDIAPAPAGVLSGDGAVWAGTEMVVIGGPGSRAAAAYHPGTDSWTQLPPVPGGGRQRPLLAWTGREVLLWGGNGGGGGPSASGVAYDPATNRWRSLSPAPASLTVGIAAVWTGQRLLVWGGPSTLPAGQANVAGAATYDPETDTWQELPAPPVALSYAAAVWTGQEAIFWGGVVVNEPTGTYRGTDGASYDPSTGHWRRLPPSGLDAQSSPAAWDGRELVAWSYGLTARAYNPATDAWRALPPPPLRAGECHSEAVATDRGVFAWYCGQAALYQPAGRWIPQPDPLVDVGVPVWTGRQIVLWGLPPAAGASSTGAVLTPVMSG